MHTGGILMKYKPTEATPEPYKRVVARVAEVPDGTYGHLTFSFKDCEVYMDADGHWWHSSTEPANGRIIWWKPTW